MKLRAAGDRPPNQVGWIEYQRSEDHFDSAGDVNRSLIFQRAMHICDGAGSPVKILTESVLPPYRQFSTRHLELRTSVETQPAGFTGN